MSAGLESGDKSSILETADMSLQSLQYLESKAGSENMVFLILLST
jgi:hypothetical protein